MSSTERAPQRWALPAIAWLLGLALLQQCARLPTAGEFAVLLAVLALLSVLLLLRRGPPWLWLALAALLLAFAQGAWRAEQRLRESLPEAWEGRDLLLRGRVASLPTAVLGQGGAPGWRFEFEVDEARAGPSAQDPVLDLVPRRLLLSLYGQPGDEAAPAIVAGERRQWPARLKRPHGLMNPYGFDYELWLFEQDLRATGVARPGGAMQQVLTPAPGWSLDGWRQRLREALQRRVADPAAAGVLAALSLGDQAAIARADWALFRDTGVAHLMSISGLHVTMFAWAAQALVAWLWRRSARLCLWLAAPRVARWSGVVAAFAYALFTGWGVPAQRTVWMLLTLALLRSAGLRWPWPLCILASAVVVTAIDPWAIAQPGFWLSFAAVGLLMAGGAQHRGGGLRGALREGLRGQWAASLGLAPLSLLFFQQISLVGLLANWLAIPLVSFVITPLALGGALLPPLWGAADWVLQGLLAYLRWLAGWDGAVWLLPVAPLWAQGTGLVGGALLVLPLPWRLRLCGLALLLPLLWPAPARPRPGEFELLAADIGQGTAVLLRTATRDLLYDAGPQYAPGVDAGQRVLLPLLRALGVRRLDTLLLSHRDSDHVGGAAAVMNGGLPVAELLSSLEDQHPLLKQGVPNRRCEQGQRWDWDGVRFEILHPLPGDYASGTTSNALSCVLKISSATRGALLTGDIEEAQEQALVQRAASGSLRSELLLVPHHGSKTSSSEALLDAVAPRWAVVQAGYRNRFGHPALPVLARYQARGITVLASPDCGALRWSSDHDPPQCQRQLAARYWHRPAGANAAMSEAGPWPEAGYAAP